MRSLALAIGRQQSGPGGNITMQESHLILQTAYSTT